MISRQIGLLPRYLFAAPEYLSDAPPLEHPQDLAHHQCVIQAASGKQSRWTLTSGKQTITVDVSGRYCANNVSMCRTLATLGVGIAISAGPEMRDDALRGTLRRVLPEWDVSPAPVHAIIESRLIPSRVRLFIDFMQASLKGYAAHQGRGQGRGQV